MGPAPVAHASAHDPELQERVRRLRSQFFTGPILDRLDLDSLDPARRPPHSQLGVVGHFQYADRYPWITPETMLPFVVAAGIKWVRTGLLYDHWDWSTGGPGDQVRHWVEAELRAGVKPLFTVNNNVNVGTAKEISGWVDLVRGAVAEWGQDVGAFMFGNEPGNEIWKNHYGGDYAGGHRVAAYARFVEEASKQVKAEHPNVTLVNGVQVEQVAMTQLEQSSPLIDALCMHHYTFKHGLPPEYNPRTADPRFKDFATSDPEFARTMNDYLRQGRMLLGNPDLQLWMTEVGIPSAAGREFEPDTLEPMSLTQQAKTVARMLVLGFLAVDKTFVYTLGAQGHDPARELDNYGLVTDEVTPKPAYFVLGRISALTGGQATPDPRFLATVSRFEGGALPTYVKQIGSPVARLVKERIEAKRFVTGDGRGLVAIWSSAPPRERFPARQATFAVTTSLGARPLVVDPLTGSSQVLQTHPGPSGTTLFKLDVADYPRFVLEDS
ncbi:hypothetical protein [Nonomuraea diastatica]|uniref:Glycoside hydrolase family 5 domain-containing protein n=1 Tax=Nonomuraea diastatica TaxID=1848329 RepID=A0A4R4WV54_9ACTN|nr:hypothetical protein [Nonomuraea diastatica]TDD21502.1 hypothetical protein E1294_14615 [Nonomuraea diastatica]